MASENMMQAWLWVPCLGVFLGIALSVPMVLACLSSLPLRVGKYTWSPPPWPQLSPVAWKLGDSLGISQLVALL